MLPQIVTVNPMAKHRRRAKQKRAHNRIRHRAKGSRGRTHNRVRRSRRRVANPFSVRGLTSSVMPALIGAGGAIGLDVLMAYLPLPAQLQSGWMNTLARGAGALALGYAAGKVAGKSIGQEVAAGGLIVVAYSALKGALAPTLGTSIKGLSGLADFGDYAPAYSGQSGAMVGQGMGAYMQPRMGAYMNQGRIGAYMNPAAFVGSASPVRAKQLGRFGGFGGFGSAMDSSMDEVAGM